MTRLLAPLIFVLFIVGFVTACPSTNSYPGDLLGVFAFSAKLSDTNCDPIDVPDGGTTFNATLSREGVDGARAWVTVSNFARDAGIETQSVSSYYAANVRFDTCGECIPQLQETLAVTLLSASQLEALGGKCPALLSDGGVALNGGDAPDLTPDGFNAVRACGQLVDVMVPAEGCTCASCRAVYTLDGTVQQ